MELETIDFNIDFSFNKNQSESKKVFEFHKNWMSNLIDDGI